MCSGKYLVGRAKSEKRRKNFNTFPGVYEVFMSETYGIVNGYWLALPNV